MTQLTNEHFELHDHNKAKLHKAKKFGVALSGLNNQINKLIKLTPTDKEIKLDENGNWQTTINPKYLQEQLSTCLLYTSPSPRDGLLSRMPSSA